ncbi:MAG: hypothetical protein ABIZ04_07700 [Opitutus sp.]
MVGLFFAKRVLIKLLLDAAARSHGSTEIRVADFLRGLHPIAFLLRHHWAVRVKISWVILGDSDRLLAQRFERFTCRIDRIGSGNLFRGIRINTRCSNYSSGSFPGGAKIIRRKPGAYRFVAFEEGFLIRGQRGPLFLRVRKGSEERDERTEEESAIFHESKGWRNGISASRL